MKSRRSIPYLETRRSHLTAQRTCSLTSALMQVGRDVSAQVYRRAVRIVGVVEILLAAFSLTNLVYDAARSGAHAPSADCRTSERPCEGQHG